MNNLNEDIIREALRDVIDPELAASVIDLNMIRKIEISESKVTIDLVLTAPACPLSGYITEQIRNVVGALPGVKQVDVRLLDEPWEPNDDWKSWLNNGMNPMY
jgi:metal-sulfur cluster biosynthetic enzyme